MNQPSTISMETLATEFVNAARNDEPNKAPSPSRRFSLSLSSIKNLTSPRPAPDESHVSALGDRYVKSVHALYEQEQSGGKPIDMGDIASRFTHAIAARAPDCFAGLRKETPPHQAYFSLAGHDDTVPAGIRNGLEKLELHTAVIFEGA